ncbi:hypothetical protein BB559_005037 [Furculomyces boomerangus]|uniref:Cleavage stimulation factor 50 kDa subunit n=2 Tax=Harpellales TaxID=61421 RepID=A0A2T9YB69_9FUNG|nr:hypothetical protein BB559_005037 [Furculomyces boomerangus]
MDVDQENVANKSKVISLIISQLSNYGYANLASAIAKHTNTRMTADSNDRLARLVFLGENYNESMNVEKTNREINMLRVKDDSFRVRNDSVSPKVSADELDLGDDSMKISPPAPRFSLWYQTSHKGPATTAAFSRNGQYFATGSADSTLKVVSTERLKTPADKANPDEKPVIRTLYDHRSGVNEVAFHPNGLVLASCSDDQSVKFFDLTLAQGKRSFRFIQDNFAITSMSFHPIGDFLAYGSSNGKFCIYDIKTLSGFTPKVGVDDFHSKKINKIRFNHDGGLLTTCSDDGSIRLWDGISGKNIRNFMDAHEGNPVNSLTISKNSKYILSSGMDATTKLWDRNSGKVITTFQSKNEKFPNNSNVNCSTFSSFTFNESLILTNNPFSDSVVCWDPRNGKMLSSYGGFSDPIRCITASPTELGFIACR